MIKREQSVPFQAEGLFFFTGNDSVESAEAFSDDLTAVGDHHKSAGVVLFQEIPKLDGLASFHDCQDDEFLLMGVGALTLEDRGASVQGVVDEIADGIRLVTDDREIIYRG